ncbi:MAG: bifunctional diaminohydroxyphosphoribosylaminopyrimidine deaminase/5-amino-6-(5-phosphoribosylamino)uracil reductase RibD [Colwellia sp.]|nr:bifunctional diaminohydroxyphosphoribosylaminopyrimidine deaminase/5-amino-6-(5-phosphoribosylamino)uracil reductase RibD [Colwellia sp.]MCW8863939.1 bifunctional diaminohydroxyphosphoribosylaminopyrimidine deaminase/5-amino-6-(5-phosphoribosylamino)uracil reductase RibD [Colwellia sp.]MCW9082189.1 bifunctional diaminohydroxyphosphoribosylaminopyrimidine deaminase/5-amino-6-(5-phosphoribosylamino)uracil reductase RibD [Colwellia sp.]
MFSEQDHHYMALAIKLAKQGHYTTSPNPRVGCVLVSCVAGKAKIIGSGFHQKAGQGHAEVNALLDANDKFPHLIEGATAYVTLEPCSHFGRTPPCAQGLIDSGVKRVVAAMVDPNPAVSGRGLAMLIDAGIKAESGLLENEAKALNPGFINLMTQKKPFVRCKLAASLDGKTAMQSGESKWITSSAARADVQRLRAQSCAIIAGADSILTDNAKMTVRWSELGQLKESYPQEQVRQPVRVVIDSQNRLTPELAFFSQESTILLVRGELDKLALENLPQWPHFVEQVQLPCSKNAQGQDKIDLDSLLTELAKRGFNDVLVESGSTLAGAFIEQDLVDELILFQAPKLMGGEGKSLVAMPKITKLSQAKSLSVTDIRMVGCDIRITAKFD